MMGTLDFFSGVVWDAGSVAAEAGGVNVETRVERMVFVPSAPVETLDRVEVVGVGVGVLDASLEPSFVAEASDEEEEPGGLVDWGFSPSDTRPVMVARLGGEPPDDCPTTAYCLPSPSEKNGRGSGDSLQQSTCVRSPSQHH
jgi:hypothetical protein